MILRSSCAGLTFLWMLPLSAQVNVLTYQYDNSRAGANLNETVLTTANVNQSQFGKLFAFAVDGYVYGQPLYLGNVNIGGKGTHNLVLVATEHDSVYAFDANSGAGANAAPLWHVSFINPAAGVTTVPYADTGCDQIVPELGITSTPVIDPVSGTVYVVAMTKESAGGSASYVQRLHALDISSGAERPSSPVAIQATYPGTGEGGNTLVFVPRNYKQRPGLLLLNGVVYAAFSSHCDIGTYHGWLMGYDAKTLAQVAVYNNTPNGNQGSFWEGNAAPAADSDGNIYLVAGNGTFDFPSGGGDLGESYIKLSTAATLAAIDYFAPFNFSELDDADSDVGSAGVALAGDEAGSASHPHLMVGAGKEGRIYVLDRDNLGKWHAGADSQIVASLPGAIGGGLFGNPAYFNQAVYFSGASDNFKVFPLANAMLGTSPSSQSRASFGYPGGVPSISANGSFNGIAWLLESSATLHAYDASNLGTELYNSNQNGTRDALDSYVKFSVPTVANGKVYVGTQKSLAVFGVVHGPTLTVANAASGQAGVAAQGSIISIYGSGMAQAPSRATGFPLPSTLAGASVTINDLTAPIFYASPIQINAQVPFEVPLGSTSVIVKLGGSAVSNSISVESIAPGLFLAPGGQAAALNQDGSANTPSNPAGVGSIIAVYMTGLGQGSPIVATGAAASANPLSHVSAYVSATIGGQSAQVVFAGLAPGFAGLYQVNISVPQVAAGNQPLQVLVDGVASNSGFISVR